MSAQPYSCTCGCARIVTTTTCSTPASATLCAQVAATLLWSMLRTETEPSDCTTSTCECAPTNAASIATRPPPLRPLLKHTSAPPASAPAPTTADAHASHPPLPPSPAHLQQVVRLVGRLFMGSEIGGTGKTQKREKGVSRKGRKEAGTVETENQRKEMMMGYTVLGLLLLLALAGVWATANAAGAPAEGGSRAKR